MTIDFRGLLFSQIFNLETEPEIIKIAQQLKIHAPSDEIFFNTLNEALHSIRVTIKNSYTIQSQQKITPWFEDFYKDLKHTRWDRYEYYLLHKKHFPKKVVQKIGENLKRIIELAGNPQAKSFLRKGLIVGDVQSGKTANYIGLMNLATDVKYKVIIVLTGTTNVLREQTQIRIEEGLGRANLDKGVKSINFPEYQSFQDPVYLTSREEDFSVSSRKNFQASVENTPDPVVIITKKNTTSLKNIYDWLVEYSKRKNDNKIDFSLMLIDDEADFASINTKDENDPTRINKSIRKILNLFTRSSYIGFTATPYANIFIAPESNDEMYGQDLFPSDYIYILGESNEYMGIQSIFSDDPKYPQTLQRLSIKEVESFLPLKHKKNDSFQFLSPSMKHAINVFFIANTIRDLRNHRNTHRSMLFNISRFINMHEQIMDAITEYVEDVKKSARIFSKLPEAEALKDEHLKNIKDSFEVEYLRELGDDVSFSDILMNLNEAIYRIKVVVVNTKNKDLNYLQNEEEGERVIVIGGFALSRGLTLEGLMTSYYFRNSVMYDSLLQMGRWFGYRNGYIDLCRIYMTQEVIDDFNFIALATKELKEDLRVNSSKNLTPLDFGIKVRTGQVGLIITARNKMKSATDIITHANFNKDIVETTVFSTDNERFTNSNIELIKNFIDRNKEKIKDNFYPGRNDDKGLEGVEKEEIIWFINKFLSIDTASKFDNRLITRWLEQNPINDLDKWDVAFAVGSLDDIKFDYGNGILGPSLKRKCYRFSDVPNQYRSSSSRLGSPSDGRYGLTENQVVTVKKLHNESDNEKSITQKEYFSRELNRKPLLMIYSIVPHLDDKRLIDNYLPLLSIGIPELDNSQTKYIEYKVNTTYLDLDYPEIEEE